MGDILRQIGGNSAVGEEVMARLIVWNLITLDGYFDGTKAWDLEWYPWGEELEELSLEQLQAAGGLLFGRKTYEGMAHYWSTATGEIAQLMNSIPKGVVSKTAILRYQPFPPEPQRSVL